MEDRPVCTRASVSANDFWSRVRESSDVSPDFKVRADNTDKNIERFVTPFGRQIRPRFMSQNEHDTAIPALPPLRSSRSVERMVLQDVISDVENIFTNSRDNVIISKLRSENAVLRANLLRALRINHAITHNMLTAVRSDTQ